ncbi:hypothetical protein DFQ27_004324 [Actinomortierella ambigua]|uniref:Uncharacterized protein n=1 Tax=Actinomortierella ambigua TaxID=1343610 RepID=A0A9P6Q4X2_9FUNG|nr:hypothetical protein DFQ26_004112 [Actinomortierella ambigua]KAG0259031.1 hypothetical protein DFQ27_004324 [Actinomortierella ambigua]
MASTQAQIMAFGSGEAKITFYDNEKNPTDAEPITTMQNGQYIYAVGLFRNGVKKYGFTLENKGFVSLTVKHKGKIIDYTGKDKANHLVIDFWNDDMYKPTKTDAPYTQNVGGVVLISQP